MSVASEVLTHLASLLEGKATPTPDRSIPSGRFSHTEVGQELTIADASSAPYPFGVIDPRKFQPLGTPSTVVATHVWRGQGLLLWIAYSYDEHEQFDRKKTILDDEKAIHRCLSDPCSWLAVAGAGIVDADEGEIQDDEDKRLFFLVFNIRFTLREDYR